MALDEAVARSINSLTARHAMLLPPLLAQRRPDLLRRMAAELSAGERAALDSPADRALAGDLLAQLGDAMPPEAIAPELSYSAAGVALFRYLRDRRERAGPLFHSRGPLVQGPSHVLVLDTLRSR